MRPPTCHPMTAPRFEIRNELRSDPRVVRSEAFDRELECSVMIERPGESLATQAGTANGARALREARMLARISHPNVVRLREVTAIDGVPALVLDLPAGVPLDRALAERGRLPPETVQRLGRDLARAAQAIHAEGVVHRGIAAENVFLEPGTDRAQLTGFTFAKLLESRLAQTSIDHSRRAAGGPAWQGLPTYVAPEQLAGRGADHRADVFALGCLLYRCATGREAFAADAVDFAVPRPVPELVPGFPRRLAAVIAQCLAHAPSQRLQNMLQVDEALAALEHAAPGGGRRWPLMAALPVLAVLALLVPRVLDAFSGNGHVQPQRPRVEPPPGAEMPYEPRYDRSHALVIGIDYEANAAGLPLLANAEKDARAVGERLLRIGWEEDNVELLLGPDATEDAILAGIGRLRDRAGREDRVLIYYAGHGQLDPDDERTFCLLPVDAGPIDGRPVPMRNWLRSDHLIPYVAGAGSAKHILLALDCCHAGAVAHGAPRGRDVLPRPRFGLEGAVDEPQNYVQATHLRMRARWVLTSTLRSERARDGTSSSPFAEGFLAALDRVAEGGTTLGLFEVLGWIREAVERSGAPQMPCLWNLADTQAEFLFLEPR